MSSILYLTSKHINRFSKALCLCWKNMACFRQSIKSKHLGPRWNIWVCYCQAKTTYQPLCPWITCEGYIHPTYTYNSQEYKVIYWLCYLSSKISTKSCQSLSNQSIIFLKSVIRLHLLIRSAHYLHMPKVRVKVENVLPSLKSIGCQFILQTLKPLKH